MNSCSLVRRTVFALLLAVVQIWAQSNYMPPMSGWPASIQAAWQIQGEYYGAQLQDTTKHLGGWLFANGGASYGLCLLPGGLLTLPDQPYGGWDQITRYQDGTTGPIVGTLTGTAFKVSTSTGGYISDSLTGAGEVRTMYVHNTNGTTYVLHRVKRHSPTYGLKPAQVSGVPGTRGLISLFDSAAGAANLMNWKAQTNVPALKYNYLYPGITTVADYDTLFMHIEFLSCFNPAAKGQNRANSGIYMQGRYEIQVLDSYGLAGTIDEYGAIYNVKAPAVNAELPPQTAFQTYDVYFVGRTSGAAGSTVGSAYVTIYANGVKVQDSTLITDITGAASNTFGTSASGFNLQDHGTDEVVYTNIWVVPGATVHTLSYGSLLAVARNTTAIDNFAIPPFLRKNSGMNILRLNDQYDLTGRQIREDGSILSFKPAVLFKPRK